MNVLIADIFCRGSGFDRVLVPSLLKAVLPTSEVIMVGINGSSNFFSPTYEYLRDKGIIGGAVVQLPIGEDDEAIDIDVLAHCKVVTRGTKESTHCMCGAPLDVQHGVLSCTADVCSCTNQSIPYRLLMLVRDHKVFEDEATHEEIMGIFTAPDTQKILGYLQCLDIDDLMSLIYHAKHIEKYAHTQTRRSEAQSLYNNLLGQNGYPTLDELLYIERVLMPRILNFGNIPRKNFMVAGYNKHESTVPVEGFSQSLKRSFAEMYSHTVSLIKDLDEEEV